jgi:hypothetical protein
MLNLQVGWQFTRAPAASVILLQLLRVLLPQLARSKKLVSCWV